MPSFHDGYSSAGGGDNSGGGGGGGGGRNRSSRAAAAERVVVNGDGSVSGEYCYLPKRKDTFKIDIWLPGYERI